MLFYVVSAVLFFLQGFHVIESTADVDWFLVALGFLALGLAFNHWSPVTFELPSRRRE